MLEFGTANEEVNEFSRLAPFVLSVNDDEDNKLTIVIALPVPAEDQPGYEDNRINGILSDAVMVTADKARVYEICFDTYIIYQCRNESYTTYEPDEIINGKYLVIYERSKLLEYYQDVIFDKDYDDEKADRKHYGIFTENHIIDVISNQPPEIKRLK